ncbi:hypothetical protein NPS01_07180 [Nocardioides psychrotolerans]|uniref:Peptidase MA superfamily protein n=1 Tax=Nocardioides psychrotolerans TaxID=1005945 RepID=A0A1I3D652_9ACTN|nr:hypothetical protein [Nocardioides psychrotolerans]GEP37055.1 hypothetical protein NPS01_07180 [Nocardioides psychrotolerans]SFH82210.1 hypothetical protein SAMN05216561_102370 [Nocardioides psychrotolerans]
MAGFSLLVLVAAGLVVWSVAGSEPYVAPRPEQSEARVSPAEASRTLNLLVEAVEGRDAPAATRLAPADDTVAAELLASVVENAGLLDIEDFALRFIDVSGAIGEDGTWTAAVDATWAFGGFDPGPSRAEMLVRFTSAGGGASIVDLGGGDRVTPLWLAGPATVRQTSDVLVLAEGTGAAVERSADRYLTRGRVAIPVVRQVLPQWRGPLVLEVPATEQQFDRSLDAEPGDYSGIAAVTANPDLSSAPGAPVHVFINPGQFDALRAQGAQIVITHEAAHVATHAASTRSMPQWLLEGFADYVALRDVPLPDSRTAAQVIKQVRADGLPNTLPGLTEFDATTGRAGAAYEASWIACRVLAQRGGEAALVSFYDSVKDGATVEAALQKVFSWNEQQLIGSWRTRLADLAA